MTNPAVWRVLEHKLYFDEAYDALFYRPAAALSVTLRRNVEEPVVERSLDEIGVGDDPGRRRGRARAVGPRCAPTPSRSRSRSSVLVVVFVAVR